MKKRTTMTHATRTADLPQLRTTRYPALYLHLLIRLGKQRGESSIMSLLSRFARYSFGADVTAGLSTAAVVIPKAMAMAIIAGLPVQAGLYVSLVPACVYALLGSSRTLSVSTTTTLAILTATELAIVVPDGAPARMIAAAATLAVLTGLFLLLAGVLRMGFLANLISDPVLTGFKAGIGLVILVDQLPKLLGIHIDKHSFLHDLSSIVQQSPHANLPTLTLALIMLALLFGLERSLPRAPIPLIGVAVGIAAASLGGLQQAGVALTGFVPSGLPAPELPDLSLMARLWPGALGIALMSFTESIAAGRSFARPDDPPPAPNRELIALGAANVMGGLFRGFPAGGGTSQTAVNAAAGARTQLAGLVGVAAVVATLLLLSPVMSLLPQAVLAAIVVVTAAPLLRPNDFRSILRIRRTEFVWALVACAGVVFLGTLQGILTAVAISVLTLLYQASHPPVYVLERESDSDSFQPMTEDRARSRVLPGLLILRTEGRMTFANAARVGEHMRTLTRKASPRVVILECSAIPDVEYTALRMLMASEAKLRLAGVSLWLAGLNPEALRVIQRSPLAKTLGNTRLFVNLHDAVQAYERHRPS